jgi:PAP2 superfamily
VIAGFAAPLLRRRVPAPPVITQTVAFAAPVGLCIAVRRSRTRDVAVCCLQMWAYVAAYKTPHDDVRGQVQRVHIRYPIVADRILGLGQLPSVRLQRRLARIGPDGLPRWRALDRVLVWAHWSWFAVPHGAILYIMFRHPRRFTRAATLTYAVFDVGASVYWVLPTAPPWYAATQGEAGEGALPVRRMMVEYGEFFWGDGWGSLYSVFGGNPLAAMPSLHFATSLMAASLLAETGRGPGVFGYGYLVTLGFALVYLGEHYLVDLLGGVALTLAVKRIAPFATEPLSRAAGILSRLEEMAHGEA